MHEKQTNDLSHTALPPEPLQKTILLVDDDPDIRSLMRTFLEHEGYSVLTSGDADRALQIFRSAQQNSIEIDLLLTDFYMPNRSGIELALELKNLRQDLPVLLISGAFLGSEYLDQLQQQGWTFLRKPFVFPDLLAAVHLILEDNIQSNR